MAGVRGPWGDAPPRKPKPGSGREALARRARARGGSERRKAAEAARRGLTRGSGNRRTRRPGDGRLTRPVKGAIQELVRHSRTVQQKFLVTQRLRHIGLALAALWVVWTFLIGDTSLIRLWSVGRQNHRLAEENERLHLQEAELKAEVRALSGNSDPEALEKAARVEHAMVRDGETIVRFYDPAELEDEDDR
jgi:cell division protein FtsB